MTPSKTSVPVISDVNHLLEKLLLKELPVRQNGIEISFEQPNREWSSRLGGPTLNLFLFDLRKNKLRQGQWETQPAGRGKAIRQRAPFRIDLHYLVTAWIIDGDPDQEQYLLTAALLSLSRHPYLPDYDPSRGESPPLHIEDPIAKEFLPLGLQNQPGAISLMVAEPEEFLNPSDIWSALDNGLRPAITCTVTIAFDPFQPIELDLVQHREIRTAQTVGPASDRQPDETTLEQWPPPTRELYQLEGAVCSRTALPDRRLILMGRGLNGGGLYVPPVSSDELTYRFLINQLPVGEYQLEVTARNYPPNPYQLHIPAQARTWKPKRVELVAETKALTDQAANYQVWGTVYSADPLEAVRLSPIKLNGESQKLEASVSSEPDLTRHHFEFADHLPAGDYPLQIVSQNNPPVPVSISVPSPQRLLLTLRSNRMAQTNRDLYGVEALVQSMGLPENVKISLVGHSGKRHAMELEHDQQTARSRFSTEPLPGGAYRLEIEVDDWQPVFVEIAVPINLTEDLLVITQRELLLVTRISRDPLSS